MDSGDNLIRSTVETHRHALRVRMVELHESQQRLQETLAQVHAAAPLPAPAHRRRDAANETRPHFNTAGRGRELLPEMDRPVVSPSFLAAQREERRRIARELHDEMGQPLAALLLGLKSVEQACSDEPVRKRLQELQELTDEICQAVEHLTLRLRPAVLDEVRLPEALAQHIEAWSERTGIEADFHFGPRIAARLTAEAESALYRVIQEALTNVVKHAQASRVSVVVTERGEQLTVIVEDDGRGFEVSQDRSSGGFGLVGMKERLSALGGKLDIESSPGGGTTLYARIPVESLQAEEDA